MHTCTASESQAPKDFSASFTTFSWTLPFLPRNESPRSITQDTARNGFWYFLKFGVSIMLIHFPSEVCREFIWIRSRNVQDHISHFHVKLASVEIGPSFRQIWSPRAKTAKTLFDNSVCTPLDAHSTCLDCTCFFPRLADKSLNLPNPRKSLNNMKIKPVNRDIKKDVLRRVLQDLISQTSWNDFKSTKDYWHLVCEWEWSASFDQCKTCEIMNQLGAKTSASSWKNPPLCYHQHQIPAVSQTLELRDDISSCTVLKRRPFCGLFWLLWNGVKVISIIGYQ